MPEPEIVNVIDLGVSGMYAYIFLVTIRDLITVIREMAKNMNKGENNENTSDLHQP